MIADLFADVIGAFAFLTVLPVGRLVSISNRPAGYTFSTFPLVGLVIGLIVAVVTSIRVLPGDLIAFLALFTWVALTGGLHLDGLADSCDGLLATVTPERRLEIMKDPRAGSWAVAGIALLLLGKWIALRGIPPALLILPPVLGRWAMVLAAAGFPAARTSGLAAHFREGLGRRQVVVALLLSIIIALICSFFYGRRALVPLIAAPLTVLIVGRWAARRLGGGLTGDIYGAICELVELLCLILLNVSWAA